MGPEEASYMSYIENKRKERRKAAKRFLAAAVAIVVATAMLTYTLCSAMYKKRLAEIQLNKVVQGADDEYGKLDLIKQIFDSYSYFGSLLGEEEMMEYVIKAYVAYTGDRYAKYYTQDEYLYFMSQSAGSSVGIGVAVINSSITVDGVYYSVLEIDEVTYGGPAYNAGIVKGDCIAWIGTGEEAVSVGDIGYDEALSRLRGEVGTKAEFYYFRKNGDGYEKRGCSIYREKVEVASVISSVSETDSKVGKVVITDFNYNTPYQFSKAVDELLEKGCENFVFDLRENPGGDLGSITAVLSYFLNEGDVILSTVDNKGNRVETVAQPISEYTGDLVYCNVAKEDIGKYRDKISKIAVLCNGNTASAAELFVSALRDYGLSVTVGELTYGKGSMQSIFSLAAYGYTGAIKLTTKMYFPPSGVGYDGIGISPDEGYEVQLSEEARKYDLHSLPEELDNQFLLALKAFE